MDYAFVNGKKDFSALCSSISGHKYVALDTESNSLYAYKEKLCLLQISSETINAVVDMLAVDLTPMLPIFANPNIEKIFHSADSDIRVFKATAKCKFINVFDVMLASKFIGVERCGLDSLVTKYFGIKLNKKFQKADWGKRPLTKEMLDYASGDTKYLKSLRDIMYRELEERGKLAEATALFKNVCNVEPHVQHFNEDGFIFLRGARQLNAKGLSVLRELYIAREKVAEKKDIPAFKIISEDLMLRLSSAPGEALESITNFKGVTPYVLSHYGGWMREAIKKGLETKKPLSGVSSSAISGGNHIEAVRERFLSMKKWRKNLAIKRNISPEDILDNVSMEKMAFSQPACVDDLKKIKGVNIEKIESCAADIMEFFKTHKL